MNIRIDKTKINNFELEQYRNKCNEALDKIWTQEWLTRSVTKADTKIIEGIKKTAESIKSKNKKIIVVTAGEIGKLIKAVAELAPDNEDKAELIFFGDSLSPSEYAEVLNSVDNEEFIMLAITGKEDLLSVRGAYATLKQLLVSKYGVERAAENIYAVVSDKENYIAVDANQNSCTTMFFSENISDLYAAGTEPALLVLSLLGTDIEKYLDGFREMLSSPEWDTDAVDYSISRAVAKNKDIKQENILYMQEQYAGFAEWMEDFKYGIKPFAIKMPAGKNKNEEGTFNTYLSIEKDEEDIMMPYFEGCHGDGSLNLLLDEAGDKYFFEETEKNPGVKISMEWLDAYNIGQLFAFIQLSNAITEFLYNN